MSTNQPKVIVIGAGVGGLTAAASLARAGLDVTVLEAHIYPGGCAGTFYHQGYRFDAGATLAGGFSPGGLMDQVAHALGIDSWPAHPAEPGMVVHMPGGGSITRWGDERRWQEYLDAFGAGAESFWRWQEQTADALWDLAMRLPPWLPQTSGQLIQLFSKGAAWASSNPRRNLHPLLLTDAFRPLGAHLKGMPESLRLFVDAQLLISAQATSQSTNALYGAAALDLPRRGIVHLRGGMEAIPTILTETVRRHGGKVLFRKEVTHIVSKKGKVVGVETRRGEYFPAQVVIANLPAENIRALTMDRSGNPPDTDKPPAPQHGWGAFILYIGLDESAIPAGLTLHHQIIQGEPLGENNSVFLSISPIWDTDRAPDGKRAITLSTHTDLRPWWQLYQHDRDGYEARKLEYSQRMMETARRAIPGIENASELVLPATPVTFQRFTRRAWGWVGGYPQTSLFRSQNPRRLPGLWMVGDSIFPGQSVPAVALGGLRVAADVLDECRVGLASSSRPQQLPAARPHAEFKGRPIQGIQEK
jgi:C-3',4' desaturase CrtD